MSTELLLSYVAVFADVATAIVAGFVALLAYRYSRRRDEVEFQRTAWQSMQQVNLARIDNPDFLEAIEKTYYGDDVDVDKEQVLKFAVIYIHLNIAYGLFNQIQFGVSKRGRTREQIRGFLKPLGRHKRLVEYLFVRGAYTKDFQNYVLKELEQIEPLVSEQEWAKSV